MTTPEREKVRQKKLTCTQKTASREIFSYSIKTSQENRFQSPELHQGNNLTSTKIASGIPYWPSRDPLEERGGINIYVFLHNSPMNFVDFLGLSSGKREVCKISMLVGHSASTDVGTVKRKLKESNLHDSDKIVCVTCFRVNTNSGINSVYSTVPDHRGTRVNGYIFPTDKNGMRNHDSFDKKRKDQTVCQAFVGELQNSAAEAKNMCNCCKKIEIYARSLDEGGAAWLASNVFRNRVGSAPIATVTCGTGVPNATQHAGPRSCR